VRVLRLRRYLASFSLTPVGIVALVVLVVALGLFAVDPSGVQAPAIVVAVILLIGVVGGVPVGLNRAAAWRNPSLAGRRREFDPADRRGTPDPATNSQVEDDLWRKERERRAQDRRSG
jgi:hypothetical protein